jgi:hypothetical protein
MLDQMSQNPGPTRKEACNELFHTLKLSYTNTNPASQFIKRVSDDYIKYIIHKEVYKYEEGGLGSEAGWIVFLRNDLLKTITNKLKTHIKKYNRLLLIIRCIGRFMVIYRKTLEIRYAPEGIFETEATKYWNPLLWNLSPKETVKYVSYVNKNCINK